jgi:hypothetical protein
MATVEEYDEDFHLVSRRLPRASWNLRWRSPA